MLLSDFRNKFPVGATKFVAVTDASGAYAGLVDVANVHAEAAQQNGEQDDTLTLEQVASQADSWVDIRMRFDRLASLSPGDRSPPTRAVRFAALASKELLT
jgi:CIC family chloride channel protein